MLELMSDARRAEIKARYEVATPGKWRAVWSGNTVKSHRVYAEWPEMRNIASGISPKTGNADFIAHAPEDIRDLFAENTSLRDELERVKQAKQDGRMIELPAFPQDMDDILEPLKVQSALNSEVMKLNFRREHEPKDVSILDYTVIAALYKVLKSSMDGLVPATPTDHAQGAEGGGEG